MFWDKKMTYVYFWMSSLRLGLSKSKDTKCVIILGNLRGLFLTQNLRSPDLIIHFSPPLIISISRVWKHFCFQNFRVLNTLWCTVLLTEPMVFHSGCVVEVDHLLLTIVSTVVNFLLPTHPPGVFRNQGACVSRAWAVHLSPLGWNQFGEIS